MRRAAARLRFAFTALLVAVMTIVPVADAFMCSFEADAEHARVAADDHAASSPRDEAGKGGVPDGAHEVCAHNHCHHSAANLFFGTVLGYDSLRAVRPAFQDAIRALGLYEGPMRPPRS